MAYAIQWLRSLVFIFQMYLMMLVLAIFFTPLAIIDRKWALYVMHLYARWVRFSARWLIGLKSEVRGEIPTGGVLIASKHQSFFDILIIFSVLPRPRFIMKSQLKWAPIFGYYALRIGCILVDRGKRGQAIKKMVEDVKSGKQEAGQLIIFPQGTRVAPGTKLPYKIGISILLSGCTSSVIISACRPINGSVISRIRSAKFNWS